VTGANPWRPGQWPLAVLALAGAVALGVGGWYAAYWHAPEEGSPQVATLAPADWPPAPVVLPPEQAPEPTLPIAPAATPRPPEVLLVVAVEGAVAMPGVRRMPEGARVQDLLDTAGGVTPEADLDDINLAAPLLDGTTLHIPARPALARRDDAVVLRGQPAAADRNPPHYTRSGWRPAQPGADAAGDAPEAAKPASGTTAGGKINVNTATLAELDSLPGIGPTYAARIVAEREALPFTGLEDLRRVSGIGPKRLEALRDLVVFE
jgi:competence protein ComEA